MHLPSLAASAATVTVDVLFLAFVSKLVGGAVKG